MSVNSILVVYSEQAQADHICQGIQEIGDEYQIESVNNGTDALSRMEQVDFDLVISGCFLQDMTGVNLARSVHDISPHAKLFLTIPPKSQALADAMITEDVDYVLDEPLSIAHLQYLVKKTCKEAARHKKQLGNISLGNMLAPDLARIPERPDPTLPLVKPQSMEVTPNPTNQTAEIFEELQTLRNNTNSRCVLLLSSSGHIIEHAGSTHQLDIDSISALVAANFMATTELARLVGNDAIFKSTYHTGSDYDIFSSGVSEEFLLVNIFGKNAKIGLVRFYVNQAIEVLAEMVGNDLFSVDFSDSQIEAHVKDELDALFIS